MKPVRHEVQSVLCTLQFVVPAKFSQTFFDEFQLRGSEHSEQVVLPDKQLTQLSIAVQFVVQLPLDCRVKLFAQVTHDPVELQREQFATVQGFKRQNWVLIPLTTGFTIEKPLLHSVQGPFIHLLQFFTVQNGLHKVLKEFNL